MQSCALSLGRDPSGIAAGAGDSHRITRLQHQSGSEVGRLGSATSSNRAIADPCEIRCRRQLDYRAACLPYYHRRPTDYILSCKPRRVARSGLEGNDGDPALSGTAGLVRLTPTLELVPSQTHRGCRTHDRVRRPVAWGRATGVQATDWHWGHFSEASSILPTALRRDTASWAGGARSLQA